MHIVSFNYLPVAWAYTYGKKDGIQCNRYGTRKYCVFNSSSAVFSGKNQNIIYPILKYSTKYFIFCHVHVFSTDFAKFYWLHGPARFLVNFTKSWNSRRSVWLLINNIHKTFNGRSVTGMSLLLNVWLFFGKLRKKHWRVQKQTFQQVSKISKNFWKSSEVFGNFQKKQRMLQSTQTYFEFRFEIFVNYQKSSENFKHYYKMLKTTFQHLKFFFEIFRNCRKSLETFGILQKKSENVGKFSKQSSDNFSKFSKFFGNVRKCSENFGNTQKIF